MKDTIPNENNFVAYNVFTIEWVYLKFYVNETDVAI